VNKAQLIEALSERLGDKKAAGAAVDGLVDVIVRTVNKGEKVNITGFGVFEKRARAARTARNPRTGETVKVKKTTVPAFRAGTTFKDVISGAKKLPKATATRASAGRSTTSTRSAASTRSTTTGRAAATRTTTTRTRATAAKPAARTTARATTAKKAAPKTAAKSTARKATPAKRATPAKKATPARATRPAAKKTGKK
jgi:DNA-binding protein HU-beta